MIDIKNLSHYYGNKICFRNFSSSIYPGDRIGIIGDNGTGKSTLLKIIEGKITPSEGHIAIPEGIVIASVPQIIFQNDTLSGGLRFNKALSQALSQHPDVLCLDEPTNHLDKHNRRSLMKMLDRYHGILLISTHDEELLNNTISTIWHIVEQEIRVFTGGYYYYMKQREEESEKLNNELTLLAKKRDKAHSSLMASQERAKKSKEKGEKKYKNAPKVLKNKKQNQAEGTSGRQLKNIQNEQKKIIEALDHLHIPEVITPTFTISSKYSSPNKTIVYIHEGSCGYKNHDPILEDINFQLMGNQRVAIEGKNGSGKSTFLKAILNDDNIVKNGTWEAPLINQIGYLDQHYSRLDLDSTVLEITEKFMPNTPMAEIRKHLGTFLFREKNIVNQKISTLSGGEKCRLSLALIAIQNPRLLILDEITNNLDLTTKNHVVQILKAFEGAILIISHDPEFLKEIKISETFVIEKKKILSN